MSRSTIDRSDTISDKEIVFDDIFDCCSKLSRERGISDSTVNNVITFIKSIDDTDKSEIYKELLSKTLRLGVTAKTVNKVIHGLIPEWEVQQAYPIDRYPIPDGVEFWLTQKLNGARATFYEGNLHARSGAVYEGLEHIINEINSFNLNGYVLDGELTLLDKGSLSDNEAFRVSTGILNSDEKNKTRIQYTVFDIVDPSEFEIGYEEGARYEYRRRIMDQMAYMSSECTYVHILPVLYHGTDQSMIYKLLDKMVEEDKEGLVANLNVPYKRKRHKGILKVKQFYTMDLPIIGCEEGSGRLSGTLGALVLDYKGNEIRVGSGFSDSQRENIWNLRNEICGTLCEVKYKEISKDKRTGDESLQFPIFVSLRTDKTEVSYG